MCVQQGCWGVDEHHTDQNHQNDGEGTHHLFGAIAQISAVDFRQTRAFIAQGNHASEIIVDGTGKDAAQHNPKERSRAELCSHNGPNDRANTRNIKELDEENAPGFHRHIVHAVGHGGGWGGALWVGTKRFFNKLSVNEIAYNQDGQCDKESNHRFE